MNKTIGIIGLGFVGGALKNGFEHFGLNNITVFDPKNEGTSLKDVTSQDIIFICVPTPMCDGGKIDDSIVGSVLSDLDVAKYRGIIVIKSTLIPTSVNKFINTFGDLKIVTNPEFLTERRAKQDFIDTEWILIGGSESSVKVIRDLYEYTYRNAPQKIEYAELSAEAAMMAKYMTNVWFAVKVSLMNEYYELWKRLLDGGSVNGSWNDLVSAFSLDKRVGKTHLSVPGPDGDMGWGGKCFPKDLNALASLCREFSSNNAMMEMAWSDNKKYRNNKDWLTIDGAVTDLYSDSEDS